MGVIALAAAGTVEGEAAAWAAACLASAFRMETRWLDPLGEPAHAYDPVREQYSSTLMLRDAVAQRPRDATKVLLLTEHDIFIPMLSFVYGQAQLGGPAAVLSLARLRQEFYGLTPNRPLFLVRIRKEVLHEIGHTFGITHCEEPICTMSLSTNIQQLDAKRDEFCESCQILLDDAIKGSDREASEGSR